jgi:uncharacterized protein (TIGR00730 family)
MKPEIVPMAKKQRRNGMPSPAKNGEGFDGLIPNVSLSRTARAGEKTEDELLLERRRLAQPAPRVPQQAEFTHGDPWRVLRILGEFVHAFDALAEVGAAIAVFGSSRTPESDPMYQAARELGARLARSGFAVITGGGPGIMEAANRGAHEAGGLSIGCNIELPREQGINPYVGVAVNFRYFFCRQTTFVKYSEGFVLFPGGYGTLDELYVALTLMQTRKVQRFPVVLFNSSYWNGLLRWMRDQVLEQSAIDAEDLTLLTVSDSVQETADLLLEAYRTQAWLKK